MTARRSDGIRLGKQHRQKVDDEWRLVFTQFKNRKRKPVTVSIIIPDELQAAIDACPPRPEQLTYLINDDGNPFTDGAFNRWFRKHVIAAGLPATKQDKARVGHVCTPHGLRKADCRIMAEAECTAHMIMGKSGHRSIKEVERYT